MKNSTKNTWAIPLSIIVGAIIVAVGLYAGQVNQKPAFDLRASWNNVLNTNEFVRVSNSEFSYIQSTYRLRPSQLLVSLKFSF